MPDGIASFDRNGPTYYVIENEGDLREDNGDRKTVGGAGTTNRTGDFGTTVFQLAPVPEPCTWALMGLGRAALGGVARRQRRG